jgi:drug/metabolite transporter (DMT)-like permease
MGYMLATTLCFSIMGAMARHVGQELEPLVVAFWRSLFAMVFMAPLLVPYGLAPFRTRKLGLHLLRNVLQALDMFAYFIGVALLPLAETTALSFTTPLFAVLFAVVVLGERIKARRIGALVVGFAGVLVVVQPGGGPIAYGDAMILISSLFWAAAITVIKRLADTDSSLTMTAYMTVLMVPFALVPALFVWQWPSWMALGLCVAMGLIGTLGHLAFAQAFRLADSTAIMPLDFTRLVWASLLGFLIFAEVPSLAHWLGGALIFASTLYIAYREARLARQAPAA